MNSRSFLFAAIIGSLSLNAFAQEEADALRYSYLQPQGTARSMGFGGALGSIGADFSALAVNPAGIGLYRSSEIMFTPSLKINGVSSDYMGSNTTDNNSRFTFNNAGVVLTSAPTSRRYERSAWKAYSFGFGINRIADFNRNYTYTGLNTTSSFSEAFSADAALYPGDLENLNTLAGLGYQSYLVDSAGGAFFPVVDYRNGTNQTRSVEERGGITDFNISFGGNYQEKLMVGATLGIPSIKYMRDVTYTETDATNNNDNDFDHFTYTESLSTKGGGINLKLGLIFKANDQFRFGAAYHTPTYFSLQDVYTRTLRTHTENFKADLGDFSGPVTTVESPEGLYEYNVITPGRFLLSASGIFNKYGFLTADFEIVNYAGARFDFDGNNTIYQNELNQGIKNLYQTGYNFRIGAEGRLDNLMGRLGFGYYSSPYKNASYGDRMDISAGIGFRFDNWYTDIAYVHTIRQTEEYPYTLNFADVGLIAPTATLNNSLNNVALTIGFKF